MIQKFYIAPIIYFLEIGITTRVGNVTVLPKSGDACAVYKQTGHVAYEDIYKQNLLKIKIINYDNAISNITSNTHV